MCEIVRDDYLSYVKRVILTVVQVAGKRDSAAAERNSQEREWVLWADRAAEEGEQPTTKVDCTGLCCCIHLPQLEISSADILSAPLACHQCSCVISVAKCLSSFLVQLLWQTCFVTLLVTVT